MKTKDTVVAPSITLEAHTNHDGGPSFDISNPLNKLRMIAASSFFGEPAYYAEAGMESKGGTVNNRLSESILDHLVSVLVGIVPPTETNGKTTSQVMEDAIDAALNFDLEATLEIAVSLRNEDYIRTTPQVILVRAAQHKSSKGTGLIRNYARQIMLRGDEPSVQMAYQLYRYGKTIPNSLKKAWKEKLESMNEYQMAKYRMENRVVKTVDVVRISHAHSDAIDKLIYGKLKLDNSTWESLISEKGSSKETWETVIDDLWIEVE